MPMNHNPSIMVTTETRVGSDGVGRIIVDLPFDGFLTTNITGYAGGLWVLWKRGEVETILLASKEQGIFMPLLRCILLTFLYLFLLFTLVPVS